MATAQQAAEFIAFENWAHDNLDADEYDDLEVKTRYRDAFIAGWRAALNETN